MSTIIQNALDAIALGSVYAVFALGIALIFGVMRLVNLAHGEIIMAAGYTLLVTGGWPWWARVGAALAVGVVLSVLMHRLAFKPLQGASAVTLMVGSLAVSALLQTSVLTWRGGNPEGTRNLPLLNDAIEIAGVRVSVLSLVSVGVVASLLVGLAVLLRRTDLGLRMRAAAEDFSMARMLGVKADAVIMFAFAIAGLLAAVGGVLVVSQTGTVTPTIGLSVMLFGLIACVLGGLGSLAGAVLGGFVLGCASVVLQATLPLELRPYRDAFLFAGVFLVILLRPEGLVRTSALQERV
ncbi:branched-chain amino acid ABC transporter permease [Capillimicrobium parvum]|uniref:High-affinity branched-chain amino acid transport system permease protein LivH n=1 Tax=Capillimicrobium parvum TaxID=2884022 RepID=A0A9E7BZR0_9ACTN|nr:branched-chain amino acid ABC transporter permease [Capillimicrobium parvum]UGS35581.1 High-affinity branched-chain amino acid transport system permease protein LivH [Capillimicrobium parvum]